MMNKLPEQQIAQWQAEVERLTPERDKQQREVDYRCNEERDLLEEGARAAEANNTVWKKQVAGKLIKCRRDLARIKTLCLVKDQQISVLNTCIHNKTLEQEGRQVKLPTAEELAQDSADAQLVIKELTQTADLAAQVEIGPDESICNDEDAILAEFEKIAQANKPQEEILEDMKMGFANNTRWTDAKMPDKRFKEPN